MMKKSGGVYIDHSFPGRLLDPLSSRPPRCIIER
jgi:hypothetical protein